MLLNLHKKTWMTGLQLTDFKEHSASNEKTVKVCVAMVVVSCGVLQFYPQDMLELASAYNKVASVSPLASAVSVLIVRCV